jgi:hypothetical protein
MRGPTEHGMPHAWQAIGMHTALLPDPHGYCCSVLSMHVSCDLEARHFRSTCETL